MHQHYSYMISEAIFKTPKRYERCNSTENLKQNCNLKNLLPVLFSSPSLCNVNENTPHTHPHTHSYTHTLYTPTHTQAHTHTHTHTQTHGISKPASCCYFQPKRRGAIKPSTNKIQRRRKKSRIKGFFFWLRHCYMLCAFNDDVLFFVLNLILFRFKAILFDRSF